MVTARDIPIGNGNLLIAFDQHYQIREWCYPLVGQENHTAGHPFHFGIACDNDFSWVDSSEWERHLDYEGHTLATSVRLRHRSWNIVLHATDVVDFHENILLRRFRCVNHGPKTRTVRLYFHHDFHVYGVDVGDTVFYDPMSQALIHYKGDRYFLMSGQTDLVAGVHDWATGRKELPGIEGTWRDAEDLTLEGNPISQGSVDSIYSLELKLLPHGEDTAYAWVASGRSLEDVRALNGLVTFESPETLIHRTAVFWNLWLDRTPTPSGSPPQAFDALYDRSLLVVRTQVDNRGGIVAANDSDIMHHSRDTYSYVWPRDGAWVARALDVSGHGDLATRFFAFCADVIDSGGYFLHKYNPNGSLASSWHPWVLAGRPELPIQEDETGTVLWALWQHFLQWRDVEQVEPWLTRLIFPAGQFLADYRDPETKLPWPSWDLWEERRGIHTYTVASVYAGLTAAAHFARAFGDASRAQAFYQAASETHQAALRHLVDSSNERLGSRIHPLERGFEMDPQADASVILVPQLGLIAPDDPLMVKSAEWIRDRLWVPTTVGGIARYENDQYQRTDWAPSVPGNPWFICTLWYTDYLLMCVQSAEDLREPARLIAWVQAHAQSSGVLPEQINPHSGEPLSVSPLTWSHAALILTIARYRRVLERLGLKPAAVDNETWAAQLAPIGY
ncbi:MAG: glycoside hydrolase family 15 protein [Sulfobacillus acidophilus]|uniref:Glycoside hydrolase family 15 protein n=1 Tax=Sulfobacillus acidophilus TaxID=53633 RepID=A0A2T2WJ46_9FIRM|nr:MAG: glycoside hydrolase family 15 protein [Sulfobacillus acidophilus]